MYDLLRNLKLQLVLLFVFVLYLPSVIAVPAYRGQISYNQPDGSILSIILYGDEFFNFRTTSDGYLLTNGEDGYLYYGKFDDNGTIRNLNTKANNKEKRTASEKSFVSTLETIDPEKSIRKFYSSTKTTKFTSAENDGIQKVFPTSGNGKSLVILVNFSDKSFVTANPKDAFTNLLNQEGYSENGGTGSARDYFRDNSNGKFNPEFSVVGPYTLPSTMATYGGNSGGGDKNPRQMVIDACTLAAADGVDFSQYDTDNDGYVDNIFIYYAGFNEAEGGTASSVWPHRWVLANTSTKFNGKIIYDYACTSELKGSSGSNMCGIGTFVHEFGHVLGLPDFYATNSATHHTLYSWDVMDYGPYNNAGRTPPNYSAYERFFTGWLTPTEILSPRNITLEPLHTSNTAFLISQTGGHNLNGKTPNPVEFILLENRQKSGWDTYLPGHGLLTTRIYYSSSSWNGNTVNNSASSMGVDIIEADGTATDGSCAGDAFPGTSNVTSFDPTLRAGTSLSKHLTEIAEANGAITFKFMGGTFPANIAPVAVDASNVGQTSFTANWNITQFVSSYLLDVFTINDNQDTVYLDGYQKKNVGNTLSYDIQGVEFGKTYYYRVSGTDGETITISSNVITVRTKVYTFDMFKPTAIAASEVSASSFTANWSWNTDIFTPERYLLTVFTKVPGSDIATETYPFNNSVIPSGWISTANLSTTSGYYGVSAPSVYFTTDQSYLQTSLYDRKIRSLSFWYRGRSAASTNALQIYASTDGHTWELIKTVQPLSNNEGVLVTLDQTEIPDCNALKFIYSKPGVGYLAIDDIVVGLQALNNVVVDGYDSIDVGFVNNYLVEGLNNNSTYYYDVVAQNGETKTIASNVISVKTVEGSTSKIVDAANNEGNIGFKREGENLVVSIGNNAQQRIQLYNMQGIRIVDKLSTSNQMLIPLHGLRPGVYVVKVGNQVKKVSF